MRTKIVYTCTTENPYSPDSISVKKLGSRIFPRVFNNPVSTQKTNYTRHGGNAFSKIFLHGPSHACTRKYSRIKFGTCNLSCNLLPHSCTKLPDRLFITLPRICRNNRIGWMDPQISIPRIMFSIGWKYFASMPEKLTITLLSSSNRSFFEIWSIS